MNSYGGRDSAIGKYYTTYLKNGLVEEEFVIYGCIYIKDKEPYLYITGKEKSFFAFQLECEKNGYYCTPGIRKTFWSTVAKGERQKLKRSYQYQVIDELKDIYSAQFFDMINDLSEIPPKEYAKELMQVWDKKLDICGDMEQLNLFESTVSMLIQMKLLTKETGRKFIARVEKLKGQFAEEGLMEGEKHTYFGLGYMKIDGSDNKIEYLMFDGYHNAWEKRQRLLMERCIVSPIISKNLFFNAVDFRIVKEYKDMFIRMLKNTINEDYFALLYKIYRLPHIMSEELYHKWKIQIRNCIEQHEKDALQLYAAKLRIY